MIILLEEVILLLRTKMINKNSLKKSLQNIVLAGSLLGASLGLGGCAAHSFAKTSEVDGTTSYTGSWALSSRTVYITTSNDVGARKRFFNSPDVSFVGRKSVFQEGEPVKVTFLASGSLDISYLRYELRNEKDLLDKKLLDGNINYLTVPYDNGLPIGNYDASFHAGNEFLGSGRFRVIGAR